MVFIPILLSENIYISKTCNGQLKYIGLASNYKTEF